MRPRISRLSGLCAYRPAKSQPFTLPIRTLTTSARSCAEASLEQSTPPPPTTLNPNLVSTRRDERILQRSGIQPIGSRRRRAALQNSANIPFEQLPYQCFQEARKVLQDDRTEKIAQVEMQRARIERLKGQDVKGLSGAEAMKKLRLESMRRHLEHLKILADINDPLVKKRFEDGDADMSRPIYRFLADRKWRARRRLIIMQRITQMHVIPDILPSMNPTADVSLSFNRNNGSVQPGEFVPSTTSETPPRLDIQLFDKHDRLVSIAVVDPDVPNLATDAFDQRCHFLAANVRVCATSPSVNLKDLTAETVRPWLPPTAQKGGPYHRLAVFVLEQPGQKVLDIEVAKRKAGGRVGFALRAFVDRNALLPIGVHMFRTQWDEGMDAVMGRVGEEAASGMELRRKRVEKAPYKKKDGARYR